jgi:uncharacterized UBP type Zn finger protein
LNALLYYFKIPKASSPGIFVNTVTGAKEDDLNDSSWRVKQVHISNTDKDKSMQALFDASMMPEEMSKKWGSDTVNTKVSRESKLQGIDKLPILPIQLVRMQGYNAATKTTLKVNVPIADPLKLVIKKEYIQGGTKDLLYELAGYIVHQGSTGNSGHYVAYIREDGQWRLYNDDKVSEVTVLEAEKAAKEAYIFFYQLLNP